VVSQINSKKIYLLGAVKKEGTISYTYRMTVMQALSEAGGFLLSPGDTIVVPH
jgi:protein involved in polysaccharide export with SLBB domain